MKPIIFLLLMIASHVAHASLPKKMYFQMRKYCTESDIKKIELMCVQKSQEYRVPPMSFFWNIAIESDFNPHVFLVNESNKYLRVGALSFTKTSCIMIGLIDSHDSWETMKKKARAFSKLPLIDQMPWIFAYYEWQKYYRYKRLEVNLTELDMRLLTFHPLSCSHKAVNCIIKKTDKETYQRNTTYDLNKDNIISRYEIYLVYQEKKNNYL